MPQPTTVGNTNKIKDLQNEKFMNPKINNQQTICCQQQKLFTLPKSTLIMLIKTQMKTAKKMQWSIF